MYLLGFMIMFVLSVYGGLCVCRGIYLKLKENTDSHNNTRVNEYKELLKYKNN